jgi:hypothetical protein
MFETTKLSPCFNGYQYLFIFCAAIIVDLIVHFFSLQKFTALKAGTNGFGFAPELMIYYRSLCRKGPFPTDCGPESFYSSCNSWLLGALIAGTVAVVLLLIADLILYGVEYRNNA